jgi:hypothetical protein
MSAITSAYGCARAHRLAVIAGWSTAVLVNLLVGIFGDRLVGAAVDAARAFWHATG